MWHSKKIIPKFIQTCHDGSESWWFFRGPGTRTRHIDSIETQSQKILARRQPSTYAMILERIYRWQDLEWRYWCTRRYYWVRHIVFSSNCSASFQLLNSDFRFSKDIAREIAKVLKKRKPSVNPIKAAWRYGGGFHRCDFELIGREYNGFLLAERAFDHLISAL